MSCDTYIYTLARATSTPNVANVNVHSNSLPKSLAVLFGGMWVRTVHFPKFVCLFGGRPIPHAHSARHGLSLCEEMFVLCIASIKQRLPLRIIESSNERRWTATDVVQMVIVGKFVEFIEELRRMRSRRGIRSK